MSFHFQLRRVAFTAAVLFLPAGAPVWAQTSGDANAVEPSQTTAVYTDWELRCRVPANQDSIGSEQELCELAQIINVTQQQTGQVERIAQIVIGKLPDAENFKIVLQTPQNVDLRKGVQVLLDPVEGVQADSAKRIGVPYLTCFSAICLADADVEQEKLDAIAASQEAQIVIGDTSGRNILIPFSVNGFSDALSAFVAKQGQ